MTVDASADFEPMADEIADPEARAQAWAERCGQAEVRAEAAEHALHALLVELGHPTADTRRVPIQRADHDVLGDIAEMLGRTIGLLEHISGKLATSSDSRSSVEIKTSTRGMDITSKCYDGSDVGDQVGPAVMAYFEAMRQVQERLNGEASK
jgi:hypothetical protein